MAAVLSQSPAAPRQAAKAKISASKAEAAVLRKYKSGKIHGKTALENEDGKWQYAVMVRAGGKMHEVMVDARNGKIASEEVVTAKEEAAENRAEASKGHATQTRKRASKGG